MERQILRKEKREKNQCSLLIDFIYLVLGWQIGRSYPLFICYFIVSFQFETKTLTMFWQWDKKVRQNICRNDSAKARSIMLYEWILNACCWLTTCIVVTDHCVLWLMHWCCSLTTPSQDLVRTADAWSKGCEFEPRQEQWENFLLQS